MPERFLAVENGTLLSRQFGELDNAAVRSLEPQGTTISLAGDGTRNATEQAFVLQRLFGG